MKKILFGIQQILILSFFLNAAHGQDVSIDDAGIETTSYNDIISVYDPFTDKLTIRSREFTSEALLNDGYKVRMMPVFIGERECYKRLCGEFKILFVADDKSIIDIFEMYPDQVNSGYPILFDGERDVIDVMSVDAQEYSDEEFAEDILESGLELEEIFFLALIASFLIEDFDQELKQELIENSHSSALVADFNYNQIMNLANSESARIRIERVMISFDDEIKSQILKIDGVLSEIRSDYAIKREVEYERNSESLDQGFYEPSPSLFELSFEGDIARVPLSQPFPRNVSNIDAELTFWFQIRPDGTVGNIVPIRKLNPELEREVMNTLSSWRFTRLPIGVPQTNQRVSVTFRFVKD